MVPHQEFSFGNWKIQSSLNSHEGLPTNESSQALQLHKIWDLHIEGKPINEGKKNDVMPLLNLKICGNIPIQDIFILYFS